MYKAGNIDRHRRGSRGRLKARGLSKPVQNEGGGNYREREGRGREEIRYTAQQGEGKKKGAK
jgi:hypothetical protein